MVASYTGPALRVQRASDGQQTDLGFSGTGTVDVEAARAYAAGTRLRVVRIYAQDGSGRDLTADAPSAPWLSLRSGGVPSLVFRQSEMMKLPAGVVFQRNAMGAFFVGRLVSQFRPTPLLDFGVSSGNSDFAWQQVFNNFRAQLIMGSSPAVTGSSMRSLGTSSPVVFGMVSTPAQSMLYRDGWSQKDAALPAGSLSGGRLLGSHLAYVYGRADMMGFVLAPGALADAESLGVKSALQTIFGTQAEAPTRHVFIQGDSITEGVGAENNITLSRALSDQFNDHKTLVRTFGKSGDRMQDSYATFLFASPGSFLEPGARNVLVTWLGTNDLATGRTLGQIQSDIRNYVRGARAQGWAARVYATALPRADLTPEREAVRQALNSWIRSNAEGLFDRVWDADALTGSGGVLEGFSSNPSLSPDHLHPSELAYERMAPSLKAVIDTLAPPM